MTTTAAFPEFLALVEDRSAALRTAAAGADLDATVPGCPDWTLRDLIDHLGMVQRFWALAVAAGPADGPPRRDAAAAPEIIPDGDLLAWSVESTELLLTALRAADPSQGCWTWWGDSDAPQTVGAVARHQVQEAAVHAYDAQETVGRAEPIPLTVAVDGVAEFVAVSLGTAGEWPHPPARVSLRAVEGASWLLDLTPSGALLTTVAESAAEPGAAATVRGTVSDLLLTLHRRITPDQVDLDGDRAVFTDLLAWPSLG